MTLSYSQTLPLKPDLHFPPEVTQCSSRNPSRCFIMPDASDFVPYPIQRTLTLFHQLLWMVISIHIEEYNHPQIHQYTTYMVTHIQHIIEYMLHHQLLPPAWLNPCGYYYMEQHFYLHQESVPIHIVHCVYLNESIEFLCECIGTLRRLINHQHNCRIRRIWNMYA